MKTLPYHMCEVCCSDVTLDGFCVDPACEAHTDDGHAIRTEDAPCLTCDGAGYVTERWVVGTWADYDGPQLAERDYPCPACEGGAL